MRDMQEKKLQYILIWEEILGKADKNLMKQFSSSTNPKVKFW